MIRTPLEFLDQQLLHARPIIRRQIHLPHAHGAQLQPHRCQFGGELTGKFALDFGASPREDVPDRVGGEQRVRDRRNGGTDQVRVQVIRKVLRHLRDAVAVNRPAHRPDSEKDASRPYSFGSSELSLTNGHEHTILFRVIHQMVSGPLIRREAAVVAFLHHVFVVAQNQRCAALENEDVFFSGRPCPPPTCEPPP